MYALGIDLGTVFTAAATWRDGHAEVATLGSRGASIPSVVLLRDDDSFLTGEAANRRALLQPSRVAREFKRRFGDSTPLLLGGNPYSAESLMAKLLGAVVADVAAREGGPPTAVCLCHPANWGSYKTDLLHQAVKMADLRAPVTLAIEPAAAAAYYARQTRIEAGSVIAVYDLGGGTFDAAVLRKTPAGFEIMGHPEGIEHLGGADFDAAVFHHVRSVVGPQLDALDDTSPTDVAAVARLRAECTEAKEALSSDTDTSIPVLLPNFATEVRLTREELERMLRPALYDTIEALKRAIRSADVEPDDLHSVLLIGGSSRMPLVAQMVGAELGRPVAVDAHPKHAVSLGAAWLASTDLPGTPLPDPEIASPMTATGSTAPSDTMASPAMEVARTAAAATTAAETGALTDTDGPADRPRPAPGSARAEQPSPTPAAATGPAADPSTRQTGPPSPMGDTPPALPAVTAAGEEAQEPPDTPPDTPPADVPPPDTPPAGSGSRNTAAAPRATVVIASLTILVVLVLVGAYLHGRGVLFSGNTSPTTSATGISGSASSPTAAASPASIYDCPTDATTLKWGCLTQAKVGNGTITIAFTTNVPISPVLDTGHFHLHVFLADPGPDGGTVPADAVMQMQTPHPGSWFNIYSKDVAAIDANTQQGGTGLGLQTSHYSLLCMRVADGLHTLVTDKAGGYHTGNCVKLT